tara:strand:+ start:222 stop:350 length:129 start_codon:yes stop_codon:yes gene_type:complete
MVEVPLTQDHQVQIQEELQVVFQVFQLLHQQVVVEAVVVLGV